MAHTVHFGNKEDSYFNKIVLESGESTSKFKISNKLTSLEYADISYPTYKSVETPQNQSKAQQVVCNRIISAVDSNWESLTSDDMNKILKDHYGLKDDLINAVDKEVYAIACSEQVTVNQNIGVGVVHYPFAITVKTGIFTTQKIPFEITGTGVKGATFNEISIDNTTVNLGASYSSSEFGSVVADYADESSREVIKEMIGSTESVDTSGWSIFASFAGDL